MDRGAWWATVHRVAKSNTTEATLRARRPPNKVFPGLGISLLLFSFFSWQFSWMERVVYTSLFPLICYLLTPCDLLSVPISKSNDNFSTVTLLVLCKVIYIIGIVLSWNSPLCSLQNHSLSVSISFQCFPVVFSDTQDSDIRARLASSLFSAVMASSWHTLLFHTCNISHVYTLSKITFSRTTEIDEYHFLLTPFLSSLFPNNIFVSWDFQIILQSVPKFSFSSSYLYLIKRNSLIFFL